MNFIESCKSFVTRAFDFNGRSTRSEFWWPQLAIQIISILFAVWFLSIPLINAGSSSLQSDSGMMDFLGRVTILAIISLVLFIPNLSLHIRRLHDAGYSGWFYLLTLIPSVGSLVVLIMCGFLPTKPENNQWGPPPAHSGIVAHNQQQYPTSDYHPQQYPTQNQPYTQGYSQPGQAPSQTQGYSQPGQAPSQKLPNPLNDNPNQ